ncbi:TetR/AcrR family transcriptional regulator [Burkholderia cepacia]|uniref:TetR/AcrR family transcriptional regulator n=1 Tax=Burkholderia cepacia TaxID=292 RepID=UPI0015893843|nr:TetR/AcrR family transcriptional regulator [Burkholderia cepacia]
MDAALEVFQARGFNGSSVQDLTDAAGVPKGSFYNHFESKEELALAALSIYVSQHGIEVLSDPKFEPLERLKRHFRANWKVVRERGYQSGCLLGSLSSEMADTHEVARAEFASYFHEWSVEIAKVIGQAQAAGTISDLIDRRAAGRFVLNAWQGTLIRAKVTKDEEAFKDFLALVFGVILAPKR